MNPSASTWESQSIFSQTGLHKVPQNLFMVKGSNFCTENGLICTVKCATGLPMHFLPPPVMSKLSSALVQSMWNRPHTCLWALETDLFTKYASLTAAAVCHLASTLSKLYKSTSIPLNCCSTWGSSNDTGTPQSYLGLSVRSISKVVSLQAIGAPSPAMCQPHKLRLRSQSHAPSFPSQALLPVIKTMQNNWSLCYTTMTLQPPVRLLSDNRSKFKKQRGDSSSFLALLVE